MNVNAPTPAYSGTMDVDEFMELLQTRPDGERWDLIEGVAIMMAPPSHAHQRIVQNLCSLLNAAFAVRRSDLFAYPGLGVRTAGVRKVVVNVHYLADALEAHLATRAHGLEVVISDERGLLMETGGGLVKAAPLIDSDPFLALNSDNLWIDGPADTIKLLASQWDEAKMDALLLLVPQARALNHRGMGDFHMDRAGRIRRRERSRVAPFVFTGIQMVSKRLLRDAPEGPFSTNLLWDRAIGKKRLFGVVHQGLWFDVGSPPNIRRTEELLGSA